MTDDLKTKIAEAIRESKIAMLPRGAAPDRMRGLTYYASVGVDYLKHDHAKAFPALIDAATKAALQAIQDAGYVLLPREPTEALCAALEYGLIPPEEDLDGTCKAIWAASYRDMIAASQPKTEGAG